MYAAFSGTKYQNYFVPPVSTAEKVYNIRVLNTLTNGNLFKEVYKHCEDYNQYQRKLDNWLERKCENRLDFVNELI